MVNNNRIKDPNTVDIGTLVWYYSGMYHRCRVTGTSTTPSGKLAEIAVQTPFGTKMWLTWRPKTHAFVTKGVSDASGHSVAYIYTGPDSCPNPKLLAGNWKDMDEPLPEKDPIDVVVDAARAFKAYVAEHAAFKKEAVAEYRQLRKNLEVAMLVFGKYRKRR